MWVLFGPLAWFGPPGLLPPWVVCSRWGRFWLGQTIGADVTCAGISDVCGDEWFGGGAGVVWWFTRGVALLLVWGVVKHVDPRTLVGGGSSWCVRRCPTLPHPGGCSTIGAERLSFRVRNGTGRFPFAMTTVTVLCCLPTRQGWGCHQFKHVVFVGWDIV